MIILSFGIKHIIGIWPFSLGIKPNDMAPGNVIGLHLSGGYHILNRVINKEIIPEHSRLKNLLYYTFQSFQKSHFKNPLCCKMTSLIWFISRGLRVNMECLELEPRIKCARLEADTSCIPRCALECVNKSWADDHLLDSLTRIFIFHYRLIFWIYIDLPFLFGQESIYASDYF